MYKRQYIRQAKQIIKTGECPDRIDECEFCVINLIDSSIIGNCTWKRAEAAAKKYLRIEALRKLLND